MSNSTNKYQTPVGLQQPAASDLSDGTTGTGAVVLGTSAALLGTPTAPTASLGTNTTQLATTAFVLANGGGIGAAASVRRNAFIYADGSTTSFQLLGETGPSITGSGPAAKNFTSAGPGIYLTVNSGSTNLGFAGQPNYLTGKNMSFGFSAWINTLATERAWFGWTDQTVGTMLGSDNPAGNYAAFRYSTLGGDSTWQCITKDNTTQTVTSSVAIPVSNAGQAFQIIFNDAVPNVKFYVGNVLVATNTTHLPTAATIGTWVIGSFNTASGSFQNGICLMQMTTGQDF